MRTITDINIGLSLHIDHFVSVNNMASGETSTERGSVNIFRLVAALVREISVGWLHPTQLRHPRSISKLPRLLSDDAKELAARGWLIPDVHADFTFLGQ
jgi:hypothetical protein